MFNDPKGNKNVIRTMMKYGEKFYHRHTVLNTSCSEVNWKSKRLPLETKTTQSNDSTVSKHLNFRLSVYMQVVQRENLHYVTDK